MIDVENVTFRHDNADAPSLRDVSLHVDAGECVLICGESGSGKTTLTRIINGLIPHYYEGEMSGRVRVGGIDVTSAPLYETARVVGSVFQNPRSQFFCVDTTSELAFACENLGLDEGEILERVEQVASQMGIKDLLGKSLFHLSGGEKQKIACGSVLALHPDVFVLDEPTSNLDLDSIDELAGYLKAWKSQGKTIVVSEHRLAWLREVCDRVIYMKNGRVEFDVSMEDFAKFSEGEVRNLGLRSMRASAHFTAMDDNCGEDTCPGEAVDERITVNSFRYSYGKTQALAIDGLDIGCRDVVAVVGSNGAGKSTFAKCLCGQLRACKGSMNVRGVVRRRRDIAKNSYMVMQDVNHQLFCESVDEELRLGARASAEEVERIATALDLQDLRERHPMSLSGGQKQRVAVASALLSGKDILIFDEPTSGMDFANMERTAQLIRSLRGKATVFVITHDPDFVQRCCTRVIHLDKGCVSTEQTGSSQD